MSEHSVAALQLEEVSDKVSDKGRPKGSAKCPNCRRTLSSVRVLAAFQPPDGGTVEMRPRAADSPVALCMALGY
jgi:hypothetical protein